MSDKTELLSFPNGHDIECPMCSSKSIDTRIEKEVFQYGADKNAVEIAVDIPVRKCGECEFEFTDEDAEDIRHDAVCKHLGRMTPLEIRGLREGYKLTRKQFAEETLLGEASLARWETGELIQNAAYDQFLYLLKYRDNLERLRKRLADKEEQNENQDSDTISGDRFRSLNNIEEHVEQAKMFKLVSR